jgi:hypothetical protein
MNGIGLPQGPYVGAPPPSDGLAQVRQEALRRRRRRLAGVVAGGTGAAVAAVVGFVLASGGGDLAVLRPAPPAGAPSPGPAPASHLRNAPDQKPQSPVHRRHNRRIVAGGDSTTTRSSGTDGAGTGTAARTGSGSAYAPGRDTPAITLQRYRSTNTSDALPKEATLCSESAYSDGNSNLHTEYGWCFTAVAKAAPAGERLTLQLCRDHTGGGTLSYPTSREVDLAVQRNGKTVWSWAPGHPGHPDRHTLTAPRDGCWNWSLVWPHVDTAGKTVRHGTYTLVATTAATELQAEPSSTARFSF